ncbi:GIY-YIG nuclease family protein [Paraliobacillus quinghaiensis]|nr:GIY-YIG nuclease family protein [Paraliobacillus quinghaiensis]
METNKQHVVYVLECSDGTLYTGYTNNLKKRIAKHEAGKGAKYTRGRGPFQLKYHQVYGTKQEAMQAEYRLKQLKKVEKLQVITANKKGVE